MLTSFFGSRRRHASRPHRSRPSSHASKTSDRDRRGDKATTPDDEVEQAVQKKPDREELRKRRQLYYSATPAQRRSITASATCSPKVKTSKASSTARSTAGKDGVRRRRKHTSSASSKMKPHTSGASQSRAADFVYGPGTSGAGQDDVTNAVESDDGVEKREARRDGSHSETPTHYASSKRRSLPTVIEAEVTPDDSISQVVERRENQRHARPRSETSTHYASSKRRSLPTVIEAEVTPDDSISQVAERRENERPTRHSHRMSDRPSLKRSSTTSTKLHSVAEDHEQHPQASPKSKSWGKRNSPSAVLPAPSRRHSTTSIPSSTKLVECLTCGSDDIPLPKSALLSCDHRMCHDCLKRIFEMSVKDPAHMPPKCCNDDHIPLKHVDKLFDLKFKILWNRKYQEYHTKNRIYCPTPKCGEWIKPKHIHKSSTDGRKYAQCPRCKTKVCTLCNNKQHKSSDCPKDPEIAKLVAQAKEKGWQRCFSCHAMVELQSGCNHMTCRCTEEFCMRCGAKWKTCNCPWFNYSQIPNPDRLNDMRVPEPVRVVLRRVMDAAGGFPPAPPALGVEAAQPRPAAAPPPEVTYQQEMDNRRQQERADAELAQRLQLASIWGDDEERPRRRASPGDETWGIGNAAGHFLNENFVHNAANVVMTAFGDTDFGRRGERSSGRRRRRNPGQGDGRGGDDAGLAPGWLGDESVLGAAPGPAAGPSTRSR